MTRDDLNAYDDLCKAQKWPAYIPRPKCDCPIAIPDPPCDCYINGGSDRVDKCTNPTLARMNCKCCGRRVPICYGDRTARMCRDCGGK